MPGEASRGGSFDSFCAFGGIETLLPYLFTGHLLKSTNLLNFSVLIATLGVSLVAGRAFCGWLCGLGAIQDFVAEWTRKLLGEKRHIRGKQSKTHFAPAPARRCGSSASLRKISGSGCDTDRQPVRGISTPARVLSRARRIRSQDDHTTVAHTRRLSGRLDFGGTLLVQISLSARRDTGASSTKSRLYGLSLTPITATTADVVISNAQWASKMCLSTWMTPNVSAVWNVWIPVRGMVRWN